MSSLRVTSLKGRTSGVSPTLPDGAVVTGVCTATSGFISAASTTAVQITLSGNILIFTGVGIGSTSFILS